MKLHLFEMRQNLPVPIGAAWDFFSDAANLVGRLLVAPRLREIFAYRRDVLERTFGAWKD
jgi:hypothetical protein